jgi:hypothetical protein
LEPKNPVIGEYSEREEDENEIEKFGEKKGRSDLAPSFAW